MSLCEFYKTQAKDNQIQCNLIYFHLNSLIKMFNSINNNLID